MAADSGHERPNGDVEIPEYTQEQMGIYDTRDEIQETLNEIELEVYEEWRMEFARWAFHMGKKPAFLDGYSKKSMYNILNRVEKFTEWVIQEKGYTTDYTADHLDEYWYKALVPNDTQLNNCRREINNASLVLKHKGEGYEIPDSAEVYEQINRKSASRFTDYFTPSELEAIKTASLRAYSASKGGASPEEQDEWAVELAQRLGAPKRELTSEDWDDDTSYKIPALTYVSRDVGFRPCEVEEASTEWVRIDDDRDARLSIPKDDDSKDGKNNWICYLSVESARLLRKWLDQREQLDDYEENGLIWRNRRGNPYNSGSLRTAMTNLMQEAGIDTEHREQGWYMLRRGVGTEIANSQGLSAVMSQLRINSIQTARRYVLSDESSVREWMDSR